MTAQVEGTEKIIDMAHKAGNWDVTVRTYPIANHVLRLGDESNSGTPFADAYVDDVISWAVGITRGLQQTSERVAGTNLYQSIAVPLELQANSGLTIYLVVLHTSMVLLLLVIGVLWLIVLVRKIWAHAHRRRYVLGLRPVFKNALITLAVATMATFCAVWCRIERSGYGRGQASVGWRSRRGSGHDVLELAGYSNGVCCCGVGVVSRVRASYRGGDESWSCTMATA